MVEPKLGRSLALGVQHSADTYHPITSMSAMCWRLVAAEIAPAQLPSSGARHPPKSAPTSPDQPHAGLRDIADQDLAVFQAAVIEASGMTDIDYTGARVLRQAMETLGAKTIQVALARLSSEWARDSTVRTGLLQSFGTQWVFR